MHFISVKVSLTDYPHIYDTKSFRILIINPCKYSELLIDQDDFPEANYTLGTSPRPFNWTDDSVSTNATIDCGPYVWAVYE